MIRILRPNSEDEQNVLIGMIVSDRYLAEVKTMLRPAMFNTPFGKTVSSWCFDYYRQYEKAPKETIQDLYQSYTRTVEEDDPNIKLIGQFLDTLSKKHSNEKSFNVEYHLDTAQRFAKRRSLEMLK
ncbi:MAG: hypothetical protein SVO01_02915, partial [Thermotogota bacterium]|nr:hypothetical protein [Thermotogota bacterium]